MHPLPRRTLRRLLAQYGPTLLDDPARVDALLADLCGPHHRERFLLTHALRERIPAELLAQPHGGRAYALRFSQRLQNRYCFSAEAAHWAVESWSTALDIALLNPNTSRDGRDIRDSNHKALSQSPQRALCQLLIDSGPALLNDPARVNALLADLCGTFPRERFLLVHALKEYIPAELLVQQQKDTVNGQRLIQRLQSRYGFSAEAALWALENWSLTLKIARSDQDRIVAEVAKAQAAADATARLKAEERDAAVAASRRKADECAAAEATARQKAEECAAAEATARQKAEECATAEATARQKAEERAAAEATARLKAEEWTAAKAAARLIAEEVEGIMLQVMENNPMTSREVAEILGKEQEQGITWLRQLQEAGKVEFVWLKRSPHYPCYQSAKHPNVPATAKDTWTVAGIEAEKAARIRAEIQVSAEAATLKKAKEQGAAEMTARLKAREQGAAEKAARQKANELAATEATARLKLREQGAAEMTARLKAREQAAAEMAARYKVKEQATAEAAVRLKVEERAAGKAVARLKAEEWLAAEKAARQMVEERTAAEATAHLKAEERVVAEAVARQKAEEQAAAEEIARQKTKEQAAAEAIARQKAKEQTAAEAIARQKAKEQTAAEAIARQKAKEQTAAEVAEAIAHQKAKEQTAAEAIARQKAKEQTAAEAIARQKAKEVKKIILQILEYDPLTSHEVALILKIEQEQAIAWLSQMQKAGKIEKILLKRSHHYPAGYQIKKRPNIPAIATDEARKAAGAAARQKVEEWGTAEATARQKAKERATEEAAAHQKAKEQAAAEAAARQMAQELKESIPAKDQSSPRQRGCLWPLALLPALLWQIVQ